MSWWDELLKTWNLGSTGVQPSTIGESPSDFGYVAPSQPAPVVTNQTKPFDVQNFYTTGTDDDRRNFFKNLGLTYGGGEAGTAVWLDPNGNRIPESVIVSAIQEGTFKGISPAKTTSTGSSVPAYIYQAQAQNYLASAELARAQLADIPLARQQATNTFIAAEAARKFGQAAQTIGLQTQNRELAQRGMGLAFDQSNVAAQAANRITELDLQQKNLQTQVDLSTANANAAALNATSQFNAQMGFNVEQANVNARLRKQEQLQSLARDVSEAAKSPGDYGKLAALTLANAGWGQENTAIGRGEDIRTTESLAPTESLLRTRRDVMASPDNPFSYNPISASLITAPIVAAVNRGNFVIPQPTITQQTVQKDKAAGEAALLGLPGQWSTSNAVSALQGGASSGDVNAALNAAIAAQTGAPTGYQGEGAAPAAPAAPAAAAEGGVVPRYEDGGVNMQDPMQAYQSGGANALYNALRSAGSSEQQAADFVNTVMRSDAALQQNTQAVQQAQAMQQSQAPMPQRPAYMPMTDAGNDTEAQLLRLGMLNPYIGGGYGTGGTYGQEDAMPAAAGWSPQIFQQAQQMPEQSSANLNFLQDYIARLRGAARKDYGYSQESNPDTDPINSLINSLFNQESINGNPFEAYLGRLRRAARKNYATGGVSNGAYISGERGPELNIPLGDKTIILNQKQMKAAGIDLKKLMSDSVRPKQFAEGGVFDQGWGNVTDPDRTMSMQFLSDALAKARAGTPWQTGALPSPVYASSPGMSPIVSQTLGSLTAMAQGIPAEYFQELAAKYRPNAMRESITQRSA